MVLTHEEMKVLVVHSKEAVVSLIREQLRGKDLAIKFNDSGLDGLFTSRLEKFDLIICGTELPVVTGYELIRAVRTYSVNRSTPVIILADEVDAKAEKLGSALGVAALLGQSDAQKLLPNIVEEQLIHWQLAHDSIRNQSPN